MRAASTAARAASRVPAPLGVMVSPAYWPTPARTAPARGAGAGDGPWTAAGDGLVGGAVARGAEARVVGLVVVAAAGDAGSPWVVGRSGFAAAGRSLAAPGLPTVFVQEGGYDLDTLGDLVLAVLDGFEE